LIRPHQAPIAPPRAHAHHREPRVKQSVNMIRTGTTLGIGRAVEFLYSCIIRSDLHGRSILLISTNLHAEGGSTDVNFAGNTPAPTGAEKLGYVRPSPPPPWIGYVACPPPLWRPPSRGS
jgi:hypothetical protein